jgi:hypothetical protein
LILVKHTLRRTARDVQLPRWRDKLNLRPTPRKVDKSGFGG